MLSEVTNTDLSVTPAREVSPETDFCCFDVVSVTTAPDSFLQSLSFMGGF